MTVHFQYKCRRCGGVHTSSMIAPEPHGWKRLLEVLKGRSTIPSEDLHDCPDGGRGITDLIGHSAPTTP